MLRNFIRLFALLCILSATALADDEERQISPVESSSATAPAAPQRTRFTVLEIKRVQAHLYRVGYYKGEVTGRLNAATQRALREWQKANSLPVTGKLNEVVLRYCD
jgi:peptidoglycan hydrolase-like protein with peptidoglycan-binding domain